MSHDPNEARRLRYQKNQNATEERRVRFVSRGVIVIVQYIRTDRFTLYVLSLREIILCNLAALIYKCSSLRKE